MVRSTPVTLAVGNLVEPALARLVGLGRVHRPHPTAPQIPPQAGAAVALAPHPAPKVSPGPPPAVNDLPLDIPDGSFMVLVGPSGSGKSTALRMVAGLETVTEGQIRIDGRVVNDVPSKDRDIAMVFQNYALYPHMTVEENLSFGLQL